MLMQQVLKKTVLALLLSAVAMMQVQTAGAADPSDHQHSKEYAKFNTEASWCVRPITGSGFLSARRSRPKI